MPETPAGQDAKDTVASLAGQLRQLQRADTGAAARLRRFHPAVHPQATVFDAERLLHAAQVPTQARGRWALVLHCLALAQAAHEARAEGEPGAVLARLGFREARVRQLVEADADVLAALLPRLARRLATAGAAVNWWPLATLWLHAGSREPEALAQADAARQRIVRHYLLAQARQVEETTGTGA